MMAESSDCVDGKVSDNDTTTATQYFCTPCQLEKKKLPAEGFCKTCDEYLCETCFRYHIRLLVSRNHVMLSKDKMPRKELAKKAENDVLEEICEHHESKIVEFYCKTCDIVGCLFCVTSEHENCEVVYIPEYTKELEANAISLEQKDTQNFRDIINEKTEEIPSKYKWTIDLHAENARDNIKTYRKEINETIDKLELKLDQVIKDKKREDFAMLDFYSEQLARQRCHLRRLFSVQAYTRSSINVKNKMFVSTKLLPHTLKQFEQCKKTLNNELMNRTYNFEADKELKSSLRTILNGTKTSRQKVKLKSIGRVDVKQKMENLKQIKSDSKCSISACIAISEDMLLLNDSENDFILLCRIQESSNQEEHGIEERNQELDILSLKPVGASPWDITQMDNKEVAVTLPLKRQIQFLMVRDTEIKLANSIDVNGKCYGIGYMDNKLYVSFEDPGKVEILDRKGRVDKTVSSSFPEGIPSFQFSHPKYVVCDTKRKMTFISDEGNDCIAVTDTDGKIKRVIHFTSLNLDRKLYHEWMRRPLAMTVEKDGALFVAADWPFSVQKVCPDSLQKDVLIHRGPAWGIRSLTSYGNKLYFGTDTGALYVEEIINT